MEGERASVEEGKGDGFSVEGGIEECVCDGVGVPHGYAVDGDEDVPWLEAGEAAADGPEAGAFGGAAG